MEQRINLSPHGTLAIYAFTETPIVSLRLLVDDGPRRRFVTPHCQLTPDRLEEFEKAERWSMKGKPAPSIESGPIRITVSEIPRQGRKAVVFLEGKMLGMVAAAELMEVMPRP